ncbi:Gag-pro-like protein [Gossypium australe]|uniref:Gag-pro-like protein n=1 Tax=Gossypium australe TaxID=47621 RepID=A0A5B6VAR7_9ROSI|nr:Gag-pro-like protein [Gossypium australe]
MGEAVAQIREVADHLQTLAIEADMLSMKYELESDRGQQLASLLRRLTQLMTGGTDKGKWPMVNVGEDNEEPLYPPGFTPTQPKVYPRRTSVTIRPQQFQDGASDLSLVPDLALPHKRMTGYVNNDPLLIHCFQDSFVGAASKWYNQLSHTRIGSWRDLAQAFMKQYSHVTDMTPDRITLQNMEKKISESFRQYAQRWREIAIQVQPPLLEKETTMLFINTLKAPFITHMI